MAELLKTRYSTLVYPEVGGTRRKWAERRKLKVDRGAAFIPGTGRTTAVHCLTVCFPLSYCLNAETDKQNRINPSSKNKPLAPWAHSHCLQVLFQSVGGFWASQAMMFR